MKIRIVSAAIAVLILFGLFHFFHSWGIFAGCTIAVLACIREYSRVTLWATRPPLHLKLVFAALAFAVFLTVFFEPLGLGLGVLAIAAVSLISMSMMTIRTSEDLGPALGFQTAGVLGLAYVGIFPGLAARLLLLPNEEGAIWFAGLLGIVFAGDTAAYFAGMMFGKRKLLEAVSPKKTIEGSIGGMVGSGLAGAIMGALYHPGHPLAAMILMALLTGAFAQVGDLFESLLKRVADVKDSGTMMPGHGGILDRLDGVLFGAPIYYVLVRFLVA
jgi:phosphatidate cytidylyltransferase